MSGARVKPAPRHAVRAALCLHLGCALGYGLTLPVHAQSAPEPAPPAQNAGDADREPIISDAEFEQSIPSLNDLDAPLDSMADFEAALADKGSGAATALTAESPPAEMPPAEQADPETLAVERALEEPLEPLGDPGAGEALLATPLPDGGGDQEDVDIRYTWRIEGLDIADAQSDADMADLFHDLSALVDGDGKAANAAMVAARATEDRKLLLRLLKSEGFYDAVVESRFETAAGTPLLAIVAVTPGPRYHIGSVTIDAPPLVPPDLATRQFAIKPGEPIIADRILGAEANLMLALPRAGYPFVTLGPRDIELDGETHLGAYVLPLDPGPRAVFDGFRTAGKQAVDANHVAVLARFSPGETYDSAKVDDLREALVATGLFNMVSLSPERTGRHMPDGQEYVRLLVQQEAGPPRTIAASAGYSTGEGFRLEGSWTHRNLFPPEGALIVSGLAGTQEQGAGVTFRRSNAGRRDRTVELRTDVLHRNYDAYEAYTGRIAGRISYDSTPIWQKRLTYGYGFELLGTNEDVFKPALGRRDRQTYWIGALPLTGGYDRSDNLLNPTRGYRIQASLSPEVQLTGTARPYVRSQLTGTAYYPVSDDIVLAGRFKLANIQGAARDNIAPSRRLYAGGGGSVRGFGYQKLGPADPDGYPIGGRSLNEVSAEVRYRFGDYGLVAFVDGGQVYESNLPRFRDMRFGAGLGARVYTNFGPMRLDVATPVKRRPGESTINVYVSIGQSF